MITPSIARINISYSLVRLRFLFTWVTKSAVDTCSPRLPIFCECFPDSLNDRSNSFRFDPSQLNKMSEANPNFRDVIVIGAGWSGLMACKCMLEEGLTAVALEKRSDVGGLWCFSEDPSIVTVMKSTKTTSSSSTTEMSDFPMPEEIGEFPKHDDVLRYLKAYCDTFNLWPHICLDHAVKQAAKKDNLWRVECDNGRVFESKFLVICTGCVQIPNRFLEDTMLKDFEGEIHHSSEFKSFIPEHKGKRVLLIGGGETASDVVEEWCDHVDRLIWSIPRGMHFFRKFAKILPNRQPQALDKASSRAMKFIAPYTKSKPGEQTGNPGIRLNFLFSFQLSTPKYQTVMLHCIILHWRRNSLFIIPQGGVQRTANFFTGLKCLM